jgi:homoserine dehydrogenase
MIGIGIMGLGTVGRATYDILRQHRVLIKQKTGLDVGVVAIAELDAGRRDSLSVENRGVFREAKDLVKDPSVDIVVELIGGTGAAYDLPRKTVVR